MVLVFRNKSSAYFQGTCTNIQVSNLGHAGLVMLKTSALRQAASSRGQGPTHQTRSLTGRGQELRVTLLVPNAIEGLMQNTKKSHKWTEGYKLWKERQD